MWIIEYIDLREFVSLPKPLSMALQINGQRKYRLKNETNNSNLLNAVFYCTKVEMLEEFIIIGRDAYGVS